jgi:hypothetical protein
LHANTHALASTSLSSTHHHPHDFVLVVHLARCTHLLKLLLQFDKVFKIVADAKYEPSDIRAAVAALEFIITSAAKYDCDTESLSNELQQLGLPKGAQPDVSETNAHHTWTENTTSLCKSYGDARAELQAALRDQTLRLARLNRVDWRVDYVVGSKHAPVCPTRFQFSDVRLLTLCLLPAPAPARRAA